MVGTDNPCTADSLSAVQSHGQGHALWAAQARHHAPSGELEEQACEAAGAGRAASQCTVACKPNCTEQHIGVRRTFGCLP